MADKAKTFLTDGTSVYILSDTDDSSSPKYYGYIRPDGHWYIQKEAVNGSVNEYRYAVGSGGYAAAWTNRASETYSYADEAFD